ncbi:hypothetical protein [Micromonospora endolithica]|uniref:EVE domain-containing protein n=1 Tax=Micromonospora endolithica TaxID=230091 RepID=A0A3A9ZI03_9ACTN|nr:hypothetical protein [Micromonospora endolithica]RKN47890.1 hypothetical protein D7223_14285 [Micromonospora endolithica]TWJ21592.1 hypothetical protein JD76_01702 [Micromonospora endolithica]
MTDRRVTIEDLGAWLLKGNADRVDLTARFARDPRVDSWCVRPGYRADLMRTGDPVVFWASGSRGRLPYGVWGVGRVAGPPFAGDPGAAWTVPLDLTVLDEARRVRRTALRADGRLAGAEVFRQPMAANPSWLTVAEFAALRTHLPRDGTVAPGHLR